jgi:hypothetical protein
MGVFFGVAKSGHIDLARKIEGHLVLRWPYWSVVSEKSFGAETFNGIHQGRFQGLEANGT